MIKRIIVSLSLVLMVSVSVAKETLPEAKPGDVLYRKDSAGMVISWPRIGGVTRVRLPEPMTLDEMKEALKKEGIRIEIDIRRDFAENGRKKIFFWLPIVFLSIAATFILKSYGLQIIGVVGFGTAVSFVLSGVIEIKMAEKWSVSTWLICGLGVVGIIAFGVSAFILKDKGVGTPGILGKWFKRLKKEED